MILYGVGCQTEHLELESSKIVVKKIARIYTDQCYNISYSQIWTQIQPSYTFLATMTYKCNFVIHINIKVINNIGNKLLLKSYLSTGHCVKE